MAGVRITANSTGRKKMIIGTVSFGGSAAAFFSASIMRLSRLSLRHDAQCLTERRAVAFRLDENGDEICFTDPARCA